MNRESTGTWMMRERGLLGRCMNCIIYLQGWPFRDALISFLRSQQLPDFSSPRTTGSEAGGSPAPPRQQPGIGMGVDDGVLWSGIHAGHRSSRTGPHVPKTASIMRTFWSSGLAKISGRGLGHSSVALVPLGQCQAAQSTTQTGQCGGRGIMNIKTSVR